MMHGRSSSTIGVAILLVLEPALMQALMYTRFFMLIVCAILLFLPFVGKRPWIFILCLFLIELAVPFPVVVHPRILEK